MKPTSNATLLRLVADEMGFAQVSDMLTTAAIDSLSPGICTSCHAIVDEIEPDQDDGYCDECDDHGPVKSVLILANLI